MTGPLDGLRVVEVGQALTGPLAGAIQADMGAEVIKDEKPDGGDDARGWGPPRGLRSAARPPRSTSTGRTATSSASRWT